MVHVGDVNLLYLSDEKDVDEDNVSRNTISVKIPGVKDENNATEVWPGYSIDASTGKD